MFKGKRGAIDWKKDSQSFDKVAHLYDAFRPSYPTGLVDDVIRLSGIQPGAKILEIGSGTGKATRLFAQRGYSIHCLEPGQNMVDVARKNLSSFPKIRYICSRFEAWQPGPARFDLLFSAQAFHWVPPEVRFAKAASVLNPGGHLALFWNMYPEVPGGIRQELDQIYQTLVPEIVNIEAPLQARIDERAASLKADNRFEGVVVRTYPWSATYETKAYLGLLNTYSDHLRLPEVKRKALFTAIGELIEQHGGQIERPYLTVLYFARKG